MLPFRRNTKLGRSFVDSSYSCPKGKISLSFGENLAGNRVVIIVIGGSKSSKIA